MLEFILCFYFCKIASKSFDTIKTEVVFETTLPDVTNTYWYVFSYNTNMGLSCAIDNTTFNLSGYNMFYFLTFMFIYKSIFFLLRTNNFWLERVATYTIVIFNLRVKPICTSIAVTKFRIHFIRSI